MQLMGSTFREISRKLAQSSLAVFQELRNCSNKEVQNNRCSNGRPRATNNKEERRLYILATRNAVENFRPVTAA